jgi:hypothetical protein
MIQSAHLVLPDGQRLDFRIRPSPKAKSLRLKMTVRDGLTVIAPKGLSESRIVELVSGKGDWIAARLAQFGEVQHLLGEQVAARPEVFDLAAMAESWRVEYRQTKARTVGACTDQPGRVVVYGAVDDNERCKVALRRWLARRAKAALSPWLGSLSAEGGLRFARVAIKNQRTRWGSCSAQGVISLNAKLLFLSPSLVRYVMMHELCHTLERNHSSRFWALLRQFEPKTDSLHGQMRDAWKMVPAWAHPVQKGRDLI